jgi:hypothetical protein
MIPIVEAEHFSWSGNKGTIFSAELEHLLGCERFKLPKRFDVNGKNFIVTFEYMGSEKRDGDICAFFFKSVNHHKEIELIVYND